MTIKHTYHVFLILSEDMCNSTFKGTTTNVKCFITIVKNTSKCKLYHYSNKYIIFCITVMTDLGV